MQITDGLSNGGEFIDIVQSVGLKCVGRRRRCLMASGVGTLYLVLVGWVPHGASRTSVSVLSLMTNCWSGMRHRPLRGQW